MLFSGIGLYGSERANLEVAKALQRQGLTVRIVVSSASWAVDMRKHLEREEFDTVTAPFLVIDQKKSVRGLIANIFRVMKGSVMLLIECFKYRPSHLFCGTQLSILSFYPALRVLSVPLVYRSGDQPILHNRVFRMSWQLLLSKCVRFVAVSEFISEGMVGHGVRRNLVEVIYSKPPGRRPPERRPPERRPPVSLTVNPQSLVDRSEKPRAESSEIAAEQDPVSFVMTFIGQIREQKGVALLAQAALTLVEDYPHLQVNFAGRISNWEGDRWANQFKADVLSQASLAPHVKFLGFIEDVPSLIRSSDVIVVPTLTQEPLANVVFEAKLEGRAVIVFPSGGLPEVVNHKVDGYVCSAGSTDALVDALRHYLEHPERASAHGQRSRASLDQFGMAAFDQTWANVFLGITNE